MQYLRRLLVVNGSVEMSCRGHETSSYEPLGPCMFMHVAAFLRTSVRTAAGIFRHTQWQNAS